MGYPCTLSHAKLFFKRLAPCKRKYVDGAVFKEQGSIGVGVVIRNAKGEVMGEMSKKICLPLGAIEAEVKAVEEGILLAWDLGLKNVVVEGDSLAVIQALNGVVTPAISMQRCLKVSYGGSRSSIIGRYCTREEAAILLHM